MKKRIITSLTIALSIGVLSITGCKTNNNPTCSSTTPEYSTNSVPVWTWVPWWIK